MFSRPDILDDQSVAKHDAPPGPRRDVELMGDEHDGDAALVQLLEQRDDLIGGAAVERAGRLVGKENVRIVGERAGDRHALLLAAGELGRLMPRALAEPDLDQARMRLVARVALVPMRVEQGEGDIVERAGARQQIEILEHEADGLVAILRERIGAHAAELVALDPERAGGRGVERADQVHEGRLAGAGMAGYGEIFAARNIDIDALQRADHAVAHPVGLGEIMRRDLRRSGARARLHHGAISRARSTA